MIVHTVSFRPGAVRRHLAERSSPGFGLGLVARRDLERYYSGLARDLAAVGLTENEAGLLCQVSDGVDWEPHAILLLWTVVAFAIESDHLDELWHVDGPALVERLRNLTYGQANAIVDAAERANLTTGPLAPQLARVGLLR